MDLNLYHLYFLFHMHLSGLTQWSFLCCFFLQWGHVFFAGASLLSFFVFFSFLPRALACLSFLQSRPHGLCSSSNNSLLEVALYADLVFSELESSLSIIE